MTGGTAQLQRRERSYNCHLCQWAARPSLRYDIQNNVCCIFSYAMHLLKSLFSCDQHNRVSLLAFSGRVFICTRVRTETFERLGRQPSQSLQDAHSALASLGLPCRKPFLVYVHRHKQSLRYLIHPWTDKFSRCADSTTLSPEKMISWPQATKQVRDTHASHDF